MPSLTPFLALLAEIEDPRRAEGKLYRLPRDNQRENRASIRVRTEPGIG